MPEFIHPAAGNKGASLVSPSVTTKKPRLKGKADGRRKAKSPKTSADDLAGWDALAASSLDKLWRNKADDHWDAVPRGPGPARERFSQTPTLGRDVRARKPPRFRVRIDHDEEDGLYYVRCLDLQGCHTFGKTRKQALARIQEVILAHLQARFHVNQLRQASKNSELVEIAA